MRLRRASDGRRKARREGIGMSENTTAERFTERLMEHRSEEQKEQYRKYFKLGEGDELVGVRMGQVFELANEFIEMLPDEIEKLFESFVHEVHAGGKRLFEDGRAPKRLLLTDTKTTRTGVVILTYEPKDPR
jgi:hypothetical protein